MATIQSSAFFVELSADSGSTWKKLVCETDSSATFETAINNLLTKCATFTSVGEKTASVDFNGVVKSDPASDEVSYEQLHAYWLADTSLQLRRENPAGGANLYQKMTGMITSMSDASAAGEFVTFSMTFTCTDSSSIDFTP